MNTYSARTCTAVTLAWPFLLAMTLTATSPNPAAAAQSTPTATTSESLPIAEGGWSLGKYLSGLNNRTRIVQFCIIIMCLALYILMRKFVPGTPPTNRNSGNDATREPKAHDKSASSTSQKD